MQFCLGTTACQLWIRPAFRNACEMAAFQAWPMASLLAWVAHSNLIGVVCRTGYTGRTWCQGWAQLRFRFWRQAVWLLCRSVIDKASWEAALQRGLLPEGEAKLICLREHHSQHDYQSRPKNNRTFFRCKKQLFPLLEQERFKFDVRCFQYKRSKFVRLLPTVAGLGCSRMLWLFGVVYTLLHSRPLRAHDSSVLGSLNVTCLM